MNTTLLAKSFLLVLVLAAAVGLFLNHTDSTESKSTKQCNIDLTQQCIVFNNGQQIRVQFLQEIELEEELFLNITVPKNTKIKNMWVQGTNMYMGKNAILTNSIYAQDQKKVYKGRLFLGACSEPVMRWQLIIQTIDETQAKQSWFFNFSTDRNKKS